MGSAVRRAIAFATAVAALLILPAGASAAGEPFGNHACTPTDGVRWCPGTVATRVPSFDGVPLDADVALPATGAGPWPLIVLTHGWGGSKVGFGDMKPWAARGYAVLAASARGFGDSCGSAQSRAADPAGCARGWVHLDDPRYEARDIQHLAGLLADQRFADPQRVGVHGLSYGGGVALELAILRDRVQLQDSSYAPWLSPAGLRMRIAATAPFIPWSDLVSALLPNGRWRDDLPWRPEFDLQPLGVMKESFVSGLYASGQASGYIAPPGVDPGADLTPWYSRIQAGEPYDGDPQAAAIARELLDHHSPLGLDDDRDPAPTFVANGWTDDLFPVDEGVRFVRRMQERHPRARVALWALDAGHQRGQNKAADMARYDAAVRAWMDRYLKGDASAPAPSGATALTQTCPASAPSGGPFRASSWDALHPGTVTGRFAAPQTVLSTGGDPDVARRLDPIAGDGACATATGDEAGTASYRLPPALQGYTLLGEPKVTAGLQAAGTFPVLALRLWDVAPDGTKTLVARGLYRVGLAGTQSFALHPGGWRFEPGHAPELQVLGRDAPYGRPSNGVFTVAISSLTLQLPTWERTPR
jgi:hypothetical protein